MVKIAEIAEEDPLLSEAFEEIVSHGGLVALIFEYHEQYVIEMLRRVEGDARGTLSRAETRNSQKTNDCPRNSAAQKWH
jgi:hypothetical protein